jgi:hypothetical protein
MFPEFLLAESAGKEAALVFVQLRFDQIGTF